VKTVLITGSETFGSYLVNPTKWLALTVKGTQIADFEIHSIIFPSVVLLPQGQENPGEQIVKRAREINAQAIISFGMASEVKGFRIERSGTNWIFNEKYLSKFENNQPLDSTRPDKEQLQADLTYWDFLKMQKLFNNAHIPFDSNISDEPGQYSCNSWIYRTLLALKKQHMNIPYLFVHTACTKDSVSLIPDFDEVNKVLITNENLLSALKIILKSLVRPEL